MSGGSYDYFYQKIENFVSELEMNEGCPDRKVVKQLFTDMAELAKIIEWVDSGDTSEKAISHSLKKLSEKYSKGFEEVSKQRYEKLLDYFEELLEKEGRI